MTKHLTSLIAPALLATLAFLLVGCADSVKDGNSVEGTDFAHPNTIMYNGKPLYCVEQGHGITCDWVRYHKENK